jgi:putative tricarboxylic transport membrane protein
MKRGWQCTGTAFAILFAVWAQQSWTLSLTDALGPGPGFFPFVLSLIGAALAIALAMRAGSIEDVSAPSGQPLFPRGRSLRTVLLVLAALAAVAFLLEPLGFRLTVAAFCLVLLPTLGARNRLVVAAFAAAASFGVYSIFADLLKVPLPVGVLGI